MFATTANAQIMYNKVKPVSLESQSFKQIQDLPIIDFPVEENGSMMQSNLNLIVKNKAIFESANDMNIARMMIKVNAQSLGNITVSFKDVLLDNNSYCLVYTQDHQIVAGPIYQKSINNNKFTIMNIPASELILEVIYKSKKDFTLKLDEVSFSSLVDLKEIKKKKQEQLLSGSCDDFGVKSFTDNVLNINFLSYTVDIPNGKLPCDSNNTTNNYNLNMGCEWMAANNMTMNDLKTFSKFNSINDIGYTDFNASRSTCNFMIKTKQCEVDSVFPSNLRYTTHNATLINIPSSSISDSICDPAIASYQIFIGPGIYQTQWADCEFTCDWMFNIGGTYNEKVIFSLDETEKLIANTNFEIEMFNYGDLLNLKVNSKIESNHFKLQLQSIEGRIIEERINQLKIGINEFPVRLNNLNTGVYMFNIFDNGKHIITRKIIIAR